MDLFPLLRVHAEEWVARLREALGGGGVLNEVMAADDEACQLVNGSGMRNGRIRLCRNIMRSQR